VFFNEALMFQGPETGYDTLGEVQDKGHSGNLDYGKRAQQAFTAAGKFFPA
jgi:hypothetical protein